MTRTDQMNLMLFHSPVGRYTHSWRRPSSRVEELFSLEWVAYSAKRAEAASFDAIFLADKVIFDGVGLNPDIGSYEPLTTLGALSAVTDRIGLISTVSTTFTAPYNTARMLAQLDFLSQGRIGWNVVTSFDGAQNFSSELPAKADRYRQAQDFFDAACAVWDAWDDDAVVVDREAGIWARPDRIHQPNYEGTYFRIADPLTMPRSPQGRPVIAQAGQSPEGMVFAARNAEVVFTSQSHLPSAQEFYRSLNELAIGSGRGPGALRILPGLLPIVGESQAEADDIAAEIADLVSIDTGLSDLSVLLVGADLSGLNLDRPVPVDRLVPLEEAVRSPLVSASRYANIYRVIVEERPTLRELIRTRSRSMGHQILTGTAQTLADRMQEWFEGDACDGFTITPTHMPEGLDRFCDLVVPELQRRGLFRTDYPGTTLRDTLGLKRPVPARVSDAVSA